MDEIEVVEVVEPAGIDELDKLNELDELELLDEGYIDCSLLKLSTPSRIVRIRNEWNRGGTLARTIFVRNT